MAFVQQDIDALDAAFKGGIRRITTSDNRTIEYVSLDEFLKLRSLMQGEAAGASSSPTGNDRFSFASFNKE